MSYYVQSVYLVQSTSIMNLSLLQLITRVSSESRMSHNPEEHLVREYLFEMCNRLFLNVHKLSKFKKAGCVNSQIVWRCLNREPKNKRGNKCDSNNYRQIAISSLLCKSI